MIDPGCWETERDLNPLSTRVVAGGPMTIARSFIRAAEGGRGHLDRLARHPEVRAAHEFMNYTISAFTGYGTPNQAAMGKLPSAVPYPTSDELMRL
jgi:hypothetical protein